MWSPTWFSHNPLWCERRGWLNVRLAVFILKRLLKTFYSGHCEFSRTRIQPPFRVFFPRFECLKNKMVDKTDKLISQIFIRIIRLSHLRYESELIFSFSIESQLIKLNFSHKIHSAETFIFQSLWQLLIFAYGPYTLRTIYRIHAPRHFVLRSLSFERVQLT